MKIIDLLNKIANGEEVPKKIKYDGIEYEEEPCYMLYEVTGECSESQLKNLLNDQVEIIEEDKKPKKIEIEYSPDIEEKIFYEDGDKPNHCILRDAGTELLINKINELIDKVNSLENNK